MDRFMSDSGCISSDFGLENVIVDLTRQGKAATLQPLFRWEILNWKESGHEWPLERGLEAILYLVAAWCHATTGDSDRRLWQAGMIGKI